MEVARTTLDMSDQDFTTPERKVTKSSQSKGKHTPKCMSKTSGTDRLRDWRIKQLSEIAKLTSTLGVEPVMPLCQAYWELKTKAVPKACMSEVLNSRQKSAFLKIRRLRFRQARPIIFGGEENLPLRYPNILFVHILF